MKLILILLAFTMSTSAIAQTSFKAERVQKTASFVVNASIEKAFPLFGPIREKEWAAGWEPQIIYSTNPEVEEHMIFKTSGKHHGENEFLWVVSQYRPNDYFVEYTVSTAQRIWFISVKCEAVESKTKVTVTYNFTGLTPAGNEINKIALEKMYGHTTSKTGKKKLIIIWQLENKNNTNPQ